MTPEPSQDWCVTEISGEICLKENIEDCDLEDLLDVTLCICNFDDPKGVPWNIA